VANWAATRGLAAKVGFLAKENPAFSTGWRIEPLLRAGRIWRDVPAAGVLEVLKQIVASLPGAPPPIRQLLAQRLLARNGVAFAPIGGGFAMPHLGTRVSLGRESGTVAFLFLKDALVVSEPMPDSVPITRLFFFVAPSPRAHLDLLGQLCRLLTHGPLRELVVRGAPDEEIFQAVAAADQLAANGHGGKETP
jgi:PTS system nitrogen regulatory IIA component